MKKRITEVPNKKKSDPKTGLCAGDKEIKKFKGALKRA